MADELDNGIRLCLNLGIPLGVSDSGLWAGYAWRKAVSGHGAAVPNCRKEKGLDAKGILENREMCGNLVFHYENWDKEALYQKP